MFCAKKIVLHHAGKDATPSASTQSQVLITQAVFYRRPGWSHFCPILASLAQATGSPGHRQSAWIRLRSSVLKLRPPPGRGSTWVRAGRGASYANFLKIQFLRKLPPRGKAPRDERSEREEAD
jgi:hypothetical protein